MKEEVICAGFGGQGIMLLGKFMAFGGMSKGLKVTWMPSYGAEVRGGTAHCMVVISDSKIASPLVSLCDTAIIMNSPSFDKFLIRVKPKGLLIVNSSLVERISARKGLTVISVPMGEIAHKLGNIRSANMVALGAYMGKKKLFSKDIVIKGLKMAFPGNKALVELNVKALEEGLSLK